MIFSFAQASALSNGDFNYGILLNEMRFRMKICIKLYISIAIFSVYNKKITLPGKQGVPQSHHPHFSKP